MRRRRSVQSAGRQALAVACLGVALSGCARANDAVAERGVPALVSIEPGAAEPIAVDVRGDGRPDLLVRVAAHRFTGHPRVTSETGRKAYLYRVEQRADWGTTYLIDEPSRYAPFTEPTVWEYWYMLPEGSTRANVTWDDGVPASKPSPGVRP